MDRLYITVDAAISPKGDILPKMIVFEDGSKFKVDRRLQSPLRQAAKDGSPDWRFPCLVQGRPVVLFHDPLSHRWWLDPSA